MYFKSAVLFLSLLILGMSQNLQAEEVATIESPSFWLLLSQSNITSLKIVEEDNADSFTIVNKTVESDVLTPSSITNKQLDSETLSILSTSTLDQATSVQNKTVEGTTEEIEALFENLQAEDQIPEDKNVVFNVSKEIISNEILKLSREGYLLLTPTEEDVAMVQKCSDCTQILEALKKPIQDGIVPNEILLLAAISPDHLKVNEVISSFSPDLASRLASFYSNPREGLGDVNNFKTISGSALSVTVGADGQPTIQGINVTRGNQISDALRANFLLNFVNIAESGEITDGQSYDVSSLPSNPYNPYVSAEENQGATPTSQDPKNIPPSSSDTVEYSPPALRADREIEAPVELRPQIFRQLEKSLRSIFSAYLNNADQNPEQTPIKTVEEVQAEGAEVPTNIQDLSKLRLGGVIDEGDTQDHVYASITTTGSTYGSGTILTLTDPENQLAIKPYSGTIPETTLEAGTVRLSGIIDPGESDSNSLILPVGEEDVDITNLDPCDGPSGDISCLQ